MAEDNPKDALYQKLLFTDQIRDRKGKLFRYTFKEAQFVFHYLTDGKHIGSRSAKLAGYEANTDLAFRVIASNLLKKPHIIAAINKAFESLTMPKMEVLFRLGRIAAGSIEDLLNEDNELDLEKARENESIGLLRKVEIKRTRREIKRTAIDTPDDGEPEILESSIIDETIKFEIHDPLRALELLGKNGKLFVEKFEHTGKDGRELPEPAKVVVYLPDNGRDTIPTAGKARTTHESRRRD